MMRAVHNQKAQSSVVRWLHRYARCIHDVKCGGACDVMVFLAMQRCVNYPQGANDPLARATKDQRNGSEYCNSKRNVY